MKELVNIQTSLKVPKNHKNNFGNYNYRNCEDILEGLKPLLKENNCIVNLSDEVVLIGDRFYIKATASIINSEGVIISSYGYAREDITKKGMDLAQVTGSVSSYARKYALNGLFAIDDTKDADSDNNSNVTINSKSKAPTNSLSKETFDIFLNEVNSAVKIEDLKTIASLYMIKAGTKEQEILSKRRIEIENQNV